MALVLFLVSIENKKAEKPDSRCFPAFFSKNTLKLYGITHAGQNGKQALLIQRNNIITTLLVIVI